MRVAPASMRTSVVEGASSLELRIPSRRNIFIVMIVLAWLGGWALGEVGGIELLLRYPARQPSQPLVMVFLVCWLILWTAAGAYVSYAWVWTAFGSESVRLDGMVLSISRQPIAIPPRREFDWQQIRHLRVERSHGRRWDLMRTPFDGRIAFDYGARTYRFGQGVDEAEAAMLIRELESRFGTRGAS